MFRFTIIRCFVVFGAVAVLCSLAGVANAELLFSDSFDTSAPYDSYGDDLMAYEIESRTSGVYGGVGGVGYASPFHAPSDVTAIIGYEDASRKVLYSESNIWGGPDHNFNNTESAGGIDIDITRRFWDTPTGAVQVSVGVGNDRAYGEPSGTNYRTSKGGLELRFRDDGAVYVNEFGTKTEGTGDLTWIDGGNDYNYHDFHLEYRGVGDNNPFDGIGQLTVKIFVDGVYRCEYTTSASFDTSNNYVGIDRVKSFKSAIDEWSITQVPEPSSIALLAAGLIGLLAYAWKKRQ